AAPDDDGHANYQTNDPLVQLMISVAVLRSAGNGDDVVQAHNQVGNEDGLHGTPDGAAALHVAMCVFFGNEQLDADPQQQHAADDLQEGDVQQHQCEGDQDHAQADGAGSTPQNALHALLGCQVAAGQRDDDGIIATQQDVDQDDLENRPPVERLKKFNHRCFRCLEALRRDKGPRATGALGAKSGPL